MHRPGPSGPRATARRRRGSRMLRRDRDVVARSPRHGDGRRVGHDFSAVPRCPRRSRRSAFRRRSRGGSKTASASSVQRSLARRSRSSATTASSCCSSGRSRPRTRTATTPATVRSTTDGAPRSARVPASSTASRRARSRRPSLRPQRRPRRCSSHGRLPRHAPRRSPRSARAGDDRLSVSMNAFQRRATRFRCWSSLRPWGRRRRGRQRARSCPTSAADAGTDCAAIRGSPRDIRRGCAGLGDAVAAELLEHASRARPRPWPRRRRRRRGRADVEALVVRRGRVARGDVDVRSECGPSRSASCPHGRAARCRWTCHLRSPRPVAERVMPSRSRRARRALGAATTSWSRSRRRPRRP